MRITGLSIRNIFFVALSVLLLTMFQNCSPVDSSDNSGQSSKSTETTALGNGDGYSGKATFYRYDLDNTCGLNNPITGEVAILSEIERDSGSYYLVRDNCQPVSRQPLAADQIGFAEHNPYFVTFGQGLFQQQNADTSGLKSIYVCKGEAASSANPMQIKSYDFVVYKSLTSEDYYMSYVIGTYAASFLVNTEAGDLLDATYTQSQEVDGSYDNFRAVDGVGGINFTDYTLSVNQSTLQGSLMGQGLANIIDNNNVDSLDCYR